MHWDTFTQDNYSTVGGDGGCRVGEVRDFVLDLFGGDPGSCKHLTMIG